MPGSICDVLPSAAALLGVSGAADALGLAESIGDVDRVMMVLVDGLGWHLLPDLVDDAPLLASVLSGGAGRLRQLTCTFPSTTPTSLVSLGTGALPDSTASSASRSTSRAPIASSTTSVGGTSRRPTNGSLCQHGSTDSRTPEWQLAPCCRNGSSGAA